jgi:hypothetical protein
MRQWPLDPFPPNPQQRDSVAWNFENNVRQKQLGRHSRTPNWSTYRPRLDEEALQRSQAAA